LDLIAAGTSAATVGSAAVAAADVFDGVELLEELELDDEPQPATISAAPTRTASQEASRRDLIGMRVNLLEGCEPEWGAQDM
jgi:hypothetical protein